MPRRDELGLFTISNGSGLSISALPNGTLFAIEYADDKGSVQINQIQGSPLTGGVVAFICVSVVRHLMSSSLSGLSPMAASGRCDKSLLERQERRYRLQCPPRASSLRNGLVLACFHPASEGWHAAGRSRADPGRRPRRSRLPDEQRSLCLAIYRPPYRRSRAFGPVVMSRQNLKQAGPAIPGWCRAASMARLPMPPMRFSWCRRDRLGDCWSAPSAPTCRASGGSTRRHAPPSSRNRSPSPASGVTATFFAVFAADHPEASSDADLSRLDALAATAVRPADIAEARRSAACSRMLPC